MAKPMTALIILDGFWRKRRNRGGQCGGNSENAPFGRLILPSIPTPRLAASGLAVGPGRADGQLPEVGHLNIGAGRVVYQG